jgi:glutamate carboxypeptidase
MRGITSDERAVLERAGAEPMLDQVQRWSALNSGSRNLAGLAEMAAIYADEFAALPGELTLREPAPVEAMEADGSLSSLPHGRNLHLKVRSDAPVQLLFTGHMDTVYGADHPFQSVQLKDEGVLGGPGVADMKGGIAVLLAALKVLETSPAAARLGYEVVINSDEEVGSPGSAALIAEAARGKRAAFTYEPSALPDGTLAAEARQGEGSPPFRESGPDRGRRPQQCRSRSCIAPGEHAALHARG